MTFDSSDFRAPELCRSTFGPTLQFIYTVSIANMFDEFVAHQFRIDYADWNSTRSPRAINANHGSPVRQDD